MDKLDMTTGNTITDDVFNRDTLNKMIAYLETAQQQPRLLSLNFSNAPHSLDKLKSLWMDELTKLPTADSGAIVTLGNVQIIETPHIPSNMMLWKFNTPSHNRLFTYNVPHIQANRNH